MLGIFSALVKTALRGGGGIYYDVGNIADLQFGDSFGDPPFDAQSKVQQPGHCGLTSLFLFRAADIGTTTQLTDYNLKQPYSIQESLILEQGVAL